MLALVAALTLSSAEPAPRPHLFASVHLFPMTSFPDLLGASVTVHAIPYVDVTSGLSWFPDRFGWWVRGGPRLQIADFRDEANRGLTWRLSALAGYRAFRDAKANAAGFSLVFSTDFTYFFQDHLGLTFQVAMGAMYDDPSKRWLPEIRGGVGLAF